MKELRSEKATGTVEMSCWEAISLVDSLGELRGFGLNMGGNHIRTGGGILQNLETIVRVNSGRRQTQERIDMSQKWQKESQNQKCLGTFRKVWMIFLIVCYRPHRPAKPFFLRENMVELLPRQLYLHFTITKNGNFRYAEPPSAGSANRR